MATCEPLRQTRDGLAGMQQLSSQPGALSYVMRPGVCDATGQRPLPSPQIPGGTTFSPPATETQELRNPPAGVAGVDNQSSVKKSTGRIHPRGFGSGVGAFFPLPPILLSHTRVGCPIVDA